MSPEEKWDKEQPGWREELIKLCEQAKKDLPKVMWERGREMSREELYNIAMDLVINEEIIKTMEED